MNPLAAVVALVSFAFSANQTAAISSAANEQGVSVHSVQCSFQHGNTQIRVLLPDAPKSDRKYPAIYVLPVEANNEARYGDGLAEVKKFDLQNKHQVIFIAPTFSHLPWYADHATNPAIRQEAYFLNVVVPFIEQTYPVEARQESRLLLGFSKSGWGP